MRERERDFVSVQEANDAVKELQLVICVCFASVFVEVN